MKALIVYKYPVFRRGLNLLLQDTYPNLVIHETDRFIYNSEDLRSVKPDIVFAVFDDLEMHQGRALIMGIRKAFPRALLIAFAAPDNYESIGIYFRSGIHGYLSNNCSLGDLNHCIEAVKNGKKFISTESLVEVTVENTVNPKNIPNNASDILKIRDSNILKTRGVELTTHERTIAGYLMQGMKTSEIAQITGRKMSTISSIKANIYKKLNVHNIISLSNLLKYE